MATTPPIPPELRVLAPGQPRYPVGFYGGAFNPPTRSHREVAQHALAVVERLLVAPSFHHPFKGAQMGLPYDDRLWLMGQVLGHLPPQRVRISDVERRLGGVGFTWDVLHRLMAEETGGVPPAVVIGEDLLGELPRWFRYHDLARDFPFVVLPDTGLHATQVREGLAAGQDVEKLVDPVVWEYLKNRGC